MKSIFKREHVLETSYDNSVYLESFLKSYQIDSIEELSKDRIVHRIDMTKREFAALCEYLSDLGKLGVYPILL